MLGPRTQAAIRDYQRSAGLPVDGEVSAALMESLTKALDEGRPEMASLTPPGELAPSEEPDASGTGFILNDRGHVLTNHHLVANCRTLRARPSGEPARAASVVATDRGNDLVLLKVEGATPVYAGFREGPSIRLADGVVAVGYPLLGLLSSQATVTTGAVNALAGLDDDSRFLQMSAPVQPGNSGGPLLDLSGNIVGVVDAKLDAVSVVEATGDIPQNVNFAIKAAVARSFLEANNVPYETAPSTAVLSAADVAERALQFTVLIECFE